MDRTGRRAVRQRGEGKKTSKAPTASKNSLRPWKTPRKILLMVQAGDTTDTVIESLIPHLQKGDILMDGGNSFFKDTNRRTAAIEEAGLHFIGAGISGGEEGARNGPSIMPGGSKEAYEQVQPILDAIAAKVDGTPCSTYMGPLGAGHYVKMVHNGIEYGDMQLISEAYFIMKQAFGLSADEMQGIFAEWNKGELDSYLIEITADILAKKDDETGNPLVDQVLDAAEQKGTGKWTSQNALDLGVSLPIVTESVFARFISAIKEERVAASKILKGPEAEKAFWRFQGTDRSHPPSAVYEQDLLVCPRLCPDARRFRRIRLEHSLRRCRDDLPRRLHHPCSVPAKIKEAFDRNPELPNLLVDPYFQGIVEQYQQSLRKVLTLAIQQGIPAPAFSSALAYFDSYRSAVLPANMIQAQRDYFGAHTYKRIDKEGTFHTDWSAN
nr:NADP-dependent phosphogluconate dehydrogenase [Planococcus glaciei]